MNKNTLTCFKAYDILSRIGASLLAAVSGDLVVNLAAVHRDDVTNKSN
jgi:hypothetical protein